MTTDFRFRGSGPGRKALILAIEAAFAAYAALIFYPLANMVLSSFRTTREILQKPFALPSRLDFSNYAVVWVDKGFGRYFLNSLWITAASMAFGPLPSSTVHSPAIISSIASIDGARSCSRPMR